MAWTGEKIKDLRRRMGWSSSDLARRLNVESDLVIEWEMGGSTPVEEMLQNLELISFHADSTAEEVAQSPLAEILMEESHTEQITLEVVKRRFTENN